MINNSMKIKDVISEHVNDAEAYVTGNQIDPELLAIKKRKLQAEQGIDVDHAEIVQDFPV